MDKCYKKLTSIKTKHVLIQIELKAEQDKRKDLQTSDLNLLIGQSYFFSVKLQNFLIFQPTFDSFGRPGDLTESLIAWKSKGLSNEIINLLLQQIIVFLLN